jgi:hypothetical protein
MVRKLRESVKTPARFQTEGVAATRPRSQSLVVKEEQLSPAGAEQSTSSTTNPPTAPNVPARTEQPTIPKLLSLAEQAAAVKAQASAGRSNDRGGVDTTPDERFYPAQTWGNLTDTMKLVLMVETAEIFDANMPAASLFLNLDDPEIDDICTLWAEEEEREDQQKLDTLEFNDYLLSLGGIAKEDLTPVPKLRLQDLQDEIRRNMRDCVPSGYDVHREDVAAAQRFLCERCLDSALRQSIIDGLKDYIGQDYSLQLIGSVYHDDELEDGDEEDVQPAQREVPQQPAGPSSASSSGNPHLPRVRSHLNIVQTADYGIE